MSIVSHIAELVGTYAIFLVLIAVCVSIIVYSSTRRGNLPPGPTPLPLIGNLWRLLTMQHPPEEMTALSERYGPVMTLRLGTRTAIMLNSYDLIQEAFVTRAHATTGRPIPFTLSGKQPTGIVMKDGPPWKSIRRFSLSTLRDFGYGRNLIQEKILEELQFIKEVLGQLPDGVHDNMRKTFTSATANVISALVLHKRFDYEDEKLKKVLIVLDSILRRHNFMDITVILDNFPVLAKQRQRLAISRENNKSVSEFVQSEVEEHKIDFDASNIRDYVDVFLKLSASGHGDLNFTESDMFFAILDLFIAGTETTATALTWGILYMMAFPEIQAKCQRQIDSVIEGNRIVRLQDKTAMPYIEATVLEILRFASIVPFGVPHRTTEDTKIGGYDIPKDSMLMSNIYAAHYDKRKFEAPNVFRPERFLDADGKIINSDFILAFSVGPRLCLGEGLARSELFLFFVNLLNYFTFSKVPGDHVDLTSAPKNATIREPLAYRVKVTQRHL